MPQRLSLLLIDDSEDDAALVLRELGKDGYQVQSERVDSEQGLRQALRQGAWDLVITDHNMPGFGSAQAIAIVREHEPDIPIIIVSGCIGEDVAVAAMKNGANDYLMKDKLGRLNAAVQRELRESKNRRQHRRAQQTIWELAHHDPLTGLYNRHEFERRVKELLQRASASNSHALLYIDLDQFKVINDTCGHHAGDAVLRQLAVILKNPVRETDTLARLGGDEFGLLLPDCAIDKAMHVAERIVNLINGFRFSWEGRRFQVGASIGLVMLEERQQSASEVLRQADLACYTAKDQGRNRVQLYQHDDLEILRRHREMDWLARINQAIEEGRLVLYHQQIHALSSGVPGHCEILLRMIDENGEVISPGSFIPAAERYGLMPTLDRWVLRQTLQQLSNTNAFDALTSERVFINLSAGTASDASFLDYLKEQLGQYGIPAHLLGFELTETAVIRNLENILAFIESVRKMGCAVALDDFGSGMSSFAYLKTIPADYLKIDGTFVRDMTNNEMDAAIVGAIHGIAKVAGLKTIAEFVENETIRLELIRLNVDFAQGFGISMPLPLPGRE